MSAVVRCGRRVPFQRASSTRENGNTSESLKLSGERKVTKNTTKHKGHGEFLSALWPFALVVIVMVA